MIDCQYRIIRFPDALNQSGRPCGVKYVGMAWNYDHAYMVVTDARDTTGRPTAWLARFDGEYVCKDDLLWPLSDEDEV